MNAHDRIFRQCEQCRYDLFLLVDVLVLWISVSFVEEEVKTKVKMPINVPHNHVNKLFLSLEMTSRIPLNSSPTFIIKIRGGCDAKAFDS